MIIRIFSLLMVLSIFLTGCILNQQQDVSIGSVKEAASIKVLSSKDVLKEEALKEIEYTENLTEEETIFVNEIRPLHFDLKTIVMRVSGQAILYITNDTKGSEITSIIIEARDKFDEIQKQLEEINAPESMNDILTTYKNSTYVFSESLTYYEKYFQTSDSKFLELYREKSNYANNEIKEVIYRMWHDEYGLH